MKKLAIMLAGVAVLALAGCEDRDGARETLLDEGYSDIAFIDRPSFFGACGRGDIYETYFVAKGPTGRSVRGVVCSGAAKGETVRILH